MREFVCHAQSKRKTRDWKFATYLWPQESYFDINKRKYLPFNYENFSNFFYYGKHEMARLKLFNFCL